MGERFVIYEVIATMNLWIISATHYSIYVEKKAGR